jgi:hypothetical protein
VVRNRYRYIFLLPLLIAAFVLDSCGNNGEKVDDEEECDCISPGGGPLSPLEAGVGITDLEVPVGISLAGFAKRKSPSHPLSDQLGASMGRYDRLQVKAVTLDNGQDRLVIVRAPLCAVNDVLYARVVDVVCERAGIDLTEKLWIGANHTHSGPARYFPVPFFLAEVGGDSWYQPAADAIVGSIADAIISSMNALKPAAIAIGVDEDFDPDDKVAQDRRCEDDPPPYKENRLFVARIDTAGGEPIAVILGYGTHGTVLGGRHYASDVLGWAEYMLQERYDSPVEVLAFSTSGGDQEPWDDQDKGHHKLARMEIIGNLVADKASTLLDTLVPAREFTFEMVSKRIPISRDEIGYKPGEFGSYNTSSGQWRDYQMGAIGCGEKDMSAHGSIVDCDNPSTSLLDGYLGPELELSLLSAWMQPWLYTHIAAVRLGADILLLFPGELTSSLATEAVKQAALTYNLPVDNVHCFGYANDHQWYLLTQESWMQGGYETAVTMWGPRFGPWIIDRTLKLAGQLFTAVDEDNVAGSPRPYYFEDHLFPPVEPEPSDREPQLIEQPDFSYQRLGTVEVRWSGGFSGTDDPRVTVQISQSGTFQEAVLPTGRVFTDQDFRTILEYEPVPDYDSLPYPDTRLQGWRFIWETTPEVPAGIYRLSLAGSWWDGGSAVPYELASASFTVSVCDRLRASDLAVVAVDENSYRITCRGWYPPNPEGYRLRHPEFAPDEWSPVEGGSAFISIEVEGGVDEGCEIFWSDKDGVFTGIFLKTQNGLLHRAILKPGSLTDEWKNRNDNETGPVVF